jgi:probable rRNA maturation factor
MKTINFFSESIPFQLKNKTNIRKWLLKCAGAEKKSVGELNYIFCNDRFLRKMNKQFLAHDYFTDIITFPSTEPGKKFIGGDIFISIDRVRDNSKTFKVTVNEELYRVMAHGLLHLCGYNDKTEKESKVMRKKETICLKKIIS